MSISTRDGYVDRMLAALQAGGCTTQRQWLETFPGVHCWFLFDTDPSRPWKSCVLCGKVKQRDPNKQKPCKGIVTVVLRAAVDSESMGTDPDDKNRFKVRFNRQSEELICGADCVAMRSNETLACMRTDGHKGRHEPNVYDAAKLDGVYSCCRVQIGLSHAVWCDHPVE